MSSFSYIIRHYVITLSDSYYIVADSLITLSFVITLSGIITLLVVSRALKQVGIGKNAIFDKYTN